jgi:hypothetical protein
MEVQLGRHTAKVVRIIPALAGPVRKQDCFLVFLENLAPDIGGVVGFPVEIPVHEYGQVELKAEIEKQGTQAVLDILAQQTRESVERAEREKRQRSLESRAVRLSTLL